MAKLSDLRITQHNSYTVNEDGSEGELVEQSEPRYVNVAENVAYASKEVALDSLVEAKPVESEVIENIIPAEPEVSADEITEGEIVENPAE